ncbi:M61 family metallopeptidase [Asticcacaulis sp.]|uniref:M61 family metallopeptidase n=1 Tax=Asticcacaulis sp. TaxID=1872648 RepID=UPI003F7C6E74
MKKYGLSLVSALALMSAVLAPAAFSQEMAPPAVPVEQPQNIPYPGTLQVTVDATDLDHRIFQVNETVPVVKSGDMVLMLPKWLPGHHSPGTELSRVADIIITANGQRLNWLRDQLDMNAFHITVPEGAKTVEVAFKYLAPVTSSAGRITMTADMVDLQWNFASMYPAGYYAKQIPVQATLKVPAGFGYATGLETDSKSGDTIVFKTTDYDTLIDSPVYAGRYFKTWDLTPKGSDTPVRLNIMADAPDMLNAPDDVIAIHRKLIEQAYKLYGAHHYNHYDFLVAASDTIGGIGLEHHRSSENSVSEKYLTDWKTAFVGRDLLAHEYTHSWNGKFRRGADLWTPNFQVPMRDSLLWVYEGQTQYWGYMLAGRSGLLSKDQDLGALAMIFASYDNLPGRKWRPLIDTTNDPIISSRSPQNWTSMQRSEDYYNEGLMIWLDADTLIREKTGGKKSLDDFAKAFFGIKNGDWGETTYTFDDVVKTLNSVYAYDWDSFLKARVYGYGQNNDGAAPTDGITRGGYKLVYQETPTDYFKSLESLRKYSNLNYSIGFSVSGKDNSIMSELWDSPAFKAGLTPGMTLVAVNGKAFDMDLLKKAITDAKTGTDPIELIVKSDDNYKTVKIDYHGGLRYPVLQRIEGKPALLDDILAEKK